MTYKNIRHHIFFLLFIFSIFNWNTSYSQTEKEAEQPLEGKTEELTAVPVIEIPQKVEEAYTVLKELEALKIPATPLEELDKQFQKLLKENESLKKESTPEFFNSLPIKKIEDYEKKWDSFLSNLLDYKTTLESGAEELSKAQDKLQDYRTIWDLTYDNAKKEKAPKAIINRLNELDRDIKNVDKSIFNTLNSILKLRDQISSEEISAKEKLSIIVDVKTNKKSMLFSLDSPPIWEALTDVKDTTTFAQRWDIAVENMNNSFQEFYELYSSQFPIYGLFFIIVLVFVIYLNRFAKANSDEFIDDQNEFNPLNLLKKPLSISILITLFFEGLFFPLAPRFITEFFNILLIIPLLTLFPVFVAKVSRGPLYFVTSIFLFQRILELLSTNSANQRVVVIALILLTIIAMIWIILIPESKVPDKRRSALKLIKLISKSLIAVLSLTLLANFIGSTLLSRLVLNGVMSTIYISLIITIAYQVFVVLFTILLKTKLANLFLTVKNQHRVILVTILKVAKLVAYIIWLFYVLKGFELYDTFKILLVDFFETSWEVGETSISVGSIILFFLAIWVAVKLSRFIRFFLDGDILPRISLPRGVPAAISLMVNYTIITLGFIFALLAVGFDLSKFAIVAGALGVGIGFGLQNIVNNFISGLILLFERPIQVGDIISIHNLIGVVKRIGIRSSIIESFDGSEEIVPNADLISGRVTNWTLSNKNKRIEIKIGVEFGADPEQVMELMRYSIANREDVLKEPPSYILFEGHDERTLNFTFRFWIPNSIEWLFIRSEVLLYINKLLKDAGIKIPYPQMDVHLDSAT
ncbi:MAG: mechanosensitive ion channel domain-containing protein, partial [Bacteroidota bacterium]